MSEEPKTTAPKEPRSREPGSREPDLAKPDKSGQLSQKQYDAVLLILGGKSDAQVGEKLQVTRQTVNTWRNQTQAFRFELKRCRENVWSQARQKLESLALGAVSAYEDVLLGPDADRRTRLAAAKGVLDYRFKLEDRDAAAAAARAAEEELLKPPPLTPELMPALRSMLEMASLSREELRARLEAQPQGPQRVGQPAPEAAGQEESPVRELTDAEIEAELDRVMWGEQGQ